jgi:hypothetical protein
MCFGAVFGGESATTDASLSTDVTQSVAGGGIGHFSLGSLSGYALLTIHGKACKGVGCHLCG